MPAEFVTIEGVKKFERKLRELPVRTASTILRKAFRPALRQVQVAIQNEIRPQVTNRLVRGRFVRRVRQRTRIKRTIGVRLVVRGGKVETAKVGVHVGKKAVQRNKKNYPWHAHLLALGTKPRKRRRIGGFYGRRFQRRWPSNEQLSTGQMPGDDFVNRGYASSRAAALATIQQIVAAELELYWRNK